MDVTISVAGLGLPGRPALAFAQLDTKQTQLYFIFHIWSWFKMNYFLISVHIRWAMKMFFLSEFKIRNIVVVQWEMFLFY